MYYYIADLEEDEKVKKLFSVLLCLVLVIGCVSALALDDTKYPELWPIMKEYLKVGVDYEQYNHFEIGASGVSDPYEVQFTFDFRKGNQGINIIINDEAFIVSTYKEGDILPLIAFNKLLPLFPEIEDRLPDGFHLAFECLFGNANIGESHAVHITSENYHLFFD